MKYNKLTILVSITILAAIIVFDVWTLLARGYESTISSQLYTLGKAQPIVPFAIGVVCGHLWWPNKLSLTEPK